jgi:hypothetical protein
MNVIQERLAYYEGAKLQSLERLLNKWLAFEIGAKVNRFFFSGNGTDSYA